MAAQKGKDVLIKVDNSGTYQTIGGLRSSSITLNDEAVDITDKDSGGNRALLPAGGVQSMTVSGSGVFIDSTAEQTLRSAYGTSSFKSYNVIVPDLGTYAGTFMIASLEYAGEYNGEVTYSFSFESAGYITYAAE